MIEACPDGEIAIGGGFDLRSSGLSSGDVNTPPAYQRDSYVGITESYPANGGWRITFEHIGAVQATIYADCLGDAAASVTTHETDFDMPDGLYYSPWEQSMCPIGSTVIGGGFSVEFPIEVRGSRAYTAADGTSGWSGEFINTSNFKYIAGAAVVAVCYNAQRPEQTAEFESVLPGTHGATYTAACPEGWTMTAATFSSLQVEYSLSLVIMAPDAQDLQWTLELFYSGVGANLASFDFAVECVQFS